MVKVVGNRGSSRGSAGVEKMARFVGQTFPTLCFIILVARNAVLKLNPEQIYCVNSPTVCERVEKER